jgi:alkylated DNA repair protein alkB family protein 6
MPHTDGLLYYPTVSTISLGSHTLLDFYRPMVDDDVSEQDRYLFSIFLEPRSLVVLKDDMYTVNLHGIKEINEDIIDSKYVVNYDRIDKSYKQPPSVKRDTRISLTIRHVPKVIKTNLNSLLFKKKI